MYHAPSQFSEILQVTMGEDPLWQLYTAHVAQSTSRSFLVISTNLDVLFSCQSTKQPSEDTFAFLKSGKLPISLQETAQEFIEQCSLDTSSEKIEPTTFSFPELVADFAPFFIQKQLLAIFVWFGSAADTQSGKFDLERLAMRSLEILTQKRISELEKICLIQEQRAIVDHITDGLLVIERSGIVRFMNATAGRILNLIPALSIGKRFADLLDFEPIIQPIFDSKTGYIDRELIIDSPGRHLHLVDTAIPIINSRGEVVSIVNTFREIQRLRKISDRLQGNHARYTFDSLIGTSSSLAHASNAAKKAAQGFANVLLNGESGVGKEVFAQAIHNASSRAEGPFIAINCAALPRDLIESELFGYTSGSFTGARKEGRPGKFESASGGTIFLDEISELPFDVQAKLLRVLQEREVNRIGDSRGIPIDVRIISASNKDLRQLVQTKEFREDLFYRCNVIGITIPSLRERREDIVVLANHFLTKYADLLKKRIFRFSDHVLEQMLNYPWPGNVRELENAVERMVNLTDDEEIEDVAFLDAGCIHDIRNAPILDTGRPLIEVERAAIVTVLRECKFNVTESAKRLGISKPTLYKKIQGHNIAMERGHK